jgi:hypothetical protein
MELMGVLAKVLRTSSFSPMVRARIFLIRSGLTWRRVRCRLIPWASWPSLTRCPRTTSASRTSFFLSKLLTGVDEMAWLMAVRTLPDIRVRALPCLVPVPVAVVTQRRYSWVRALFPMMPVLMTVVTLMTSNIVRSRSIHTWTTAASRARRGSTTRVLAPKTGSHLRDRLSSTAGTSRRRGLLSGHGSESRRQGGLLHTARRSCSLKMQSVS